MATEKNESPLPPPEPKPLEEVLAYENPFVVGVFCKQFSTEKEEAEELFRETLRWLWIKARADYRTLIYREPVPEYLNLDEDHILSVFWNVFILATQDYMEFCNDYMGRYIHFKPMSVERMEGLKGEASRDPVIWEQREQFLREALHKYLSRQLSEETADLWLNVYQEKYSRKVIDTLRPH